MLHRGVGVMMIELGAPTGMPKGYGMSNEIPDRAVRVMKELFSRFTGTPA